MKQTGIIMSGNHPKLILDGIKTMTRRVIKPQPEMPYAKFHHLDVIGQAVFTDNSVSRCPYGQVGDRLGVKETHYRYGFWRLTGELTASGKDEMEFIPLTDQVRYYDNPPLSVCKGRVLTGWYKRPSIFLPKKYIRIWCEITDIRVERVQEISEADIVAEGIKPCFPNQIPQTYFFKDLWDSLNAKRGFGWEVNPWVWVISFRLVKDAVLP